MNYKITDEYLHKCDICRGPLTATTENETPFARVTCICCDSHLGLVQFVKVIEDQVMND
jgi:hypothetical protein